MRLMFGLMLMLKTAACVERFCSFYQSFPCYAAPGDKLSLKVVDTSKHHLRIQKRISNTEKDPVCIIKYDRIRNTECDLFNNRQVSVSNSILMINTVTRADSGNYSLEHFISDSSLTSTDLQVIVEACVCPDCVLHSESSSSNTSIVHVLVWCFQMMVLLGLLGGFHIYMRLTSGKKEDYQNVRMRRFREGHADTAED